jgi:hypothetical protein
MGPAHKSRGQRSAESVAHRCIVSAAQDALARFIIENIFNIDFNIDEIDETNSSFLHQRWSLRIEDGIRLA